MIPTVQQLATNWTQRDDSLLGSNCEATVADVGDPLTPAYSRFSCLFLTVSVDLVS